MERKKITLNSHNEWDQLKEIIVGTAKNNFGSLTWNSKKKIHPKTIEKAILLSKKANPKWYIDEIEEDLSELCKILKKKNVTVKRPKVFKFEDIYSTKDWFSSSSNCYNARDLCLVVGNKLIESPSHMKNRYFETLAYKKIFYDYFESGMQWIKAPSPELNYKALTPLYKKNQKEIEESKNYSKLTKGRKEILHKLENKEILFEAANTLRMGRDLLYLESISGNKKGAKWLQSILGNDYRVHIADKLYKSSHIDSTILCLKPGMVLMNSLRVGKKECPPIFKKWDKIYHEEVVAVPEKELNFQKNIKDKYAKEIASLGFETNLKEMSSPWIGLNFLSINPTTLVVEKNQISLIKKLEKLKFDVIPVSMRHMYTMQGGLHCCTLDTVREGKLESYF